MFARFLQGLFLLLFTFFFFQLHFCPRPQRRERSGRICGPQIQQQPVRLHLHLGPEHRLEGKEMQLGIHVVSFKARRITFALKISKSLNLEKGVVVVVVDAEHRMR